MYWRLVASHGRLLRRIARRQGVVVGEWSGSFAQALFDRYPVSEHPRLVREHIEHQLHAYEYADAWFYWTYKPRRAASGIFARLSRTVIFTFCDFVL